MKQITILEAEKILKAQGFELLGTYGEHEIKEELEDSYDIGEISDPLLDAIDAEIKEQLEKGEPYCWETHETAIGNVMGRTPYLSVNEVLTLNALSREELVNGLEATGHACYDDEPVEDFREAYKDSVLAGDLFL